MGKLLVEIGFKKGMLTIIEDLGRIPYPKNSKTIRRIIKATCDCGNIKDMRLDVFKDPKINSCGCEKDRSNVVVPVGDIYGRLTIVEDLGIGKLEGKGTRCRNVRCVCECGNEIESQWSNIKYGNVKSCGCLQSETSKRIVKIMQNSNIKHGDAIKESELNRLYQVWCRMRYRCYKEGHEKYKWYGGVGIEVCDEWINDYPAFKSWALSNGYQKDLTIDRIDVTKDYTPENCQWLTAQENIEKEYTIDRETRRKQ